MEVLGWGGQLIVTIFIRAIRLRGSLFMEGSTYMLYPLAHKYSDVDRISADPLTGLAVAIGEGAVRTIPLLLTAPYRLARRSAGAAALRRQERDDRTVIHNHGLYDYGALTSVRELAMGDDLRRFFIERDVEMFDQVVHEAVFKAISRFLSDHGIDTGEVAQRITQITHNKIDARGSNFGNAPGSNFGNAPGSQFRGSTGPAQKGDTP
ncbi:hypothetical protein ACFQ0B_05185 [Nonomuraea thailandensis]